MIHQKHHLAAIAIAACGTTTAIAQVQSILLGDPGSPNASGTGEWFTYGGDLIEMSIRGEINWANNADRTITPWDDAWASSPPGPADGSNQQLPLEPYGDVLAYTASGLGDVDNDGYGDFGVTWYNADTQLAFTEDHSDSCRHHVDHASEYVGFVRIISGNPNYSGPGVIYDNSTNNADGRKSTWNRISAGDTALSFNDNTRRIGNNFWGHRSNSLWSHEINAIGDIDGDGRDDVLLTANGKANDQFGYYDGLVEIWSFTSEYNLDGDNKERWIKLVEIKGSISTGDPRALELGYQSHHGPVPKNPSNSSDDSDGFDLDFNNDGQQDLLLSSKFYRDSASGDFVGTGAPSGNSDRNYAPGAAWVFLLPTADVFQHIKANGNANTTDVKCNASGPANVSDNISDQLPLKFTSKDYSVHITGHQGYKSATNTPPTADSNTYPHHFGYDIDPAGDVDGDGSLDLIVSAPHHMRNHDPVTGNYTYNSNAPLMNGKHEGAVYIFLSNSNMDRDGSGSFTSFSELLPKYYLDTGIYPGPSPFGFVHTSSIGIPGTIKQRFMPNNQLAFTSEKADFVFAGVNDHGYTANIAAVGSSIEAGINLNGNNDPDFVIHNRLNSRAEVIPDLYSRLYAKFPGPNGVITRPSEMTEIWDSDHGTNNAYVGPLDTGPGTAVRHIDETDAYAMSRSALTYGGVGYKQFDINEQDSTDYAAIGGFRIAGNHDGDKGGDCELFLFTNSNERSFCNEHPSCDVDLKTLKKGTIVVDIESVVPTMIKVFTSYLPEHANLCTETNNTMFNKNGIHVGSDGLSAWPIWAGELEDNKDDAFIGARGYPRQAFYYPSFDPGLYMPGGMYPNAPTWLPISYPAIQSSCEYNSMSVVPAGKAYVVRTP